MKHAMLQIMKHNHQKMSHNHFRLPADDARALVARMQGSSLKCNNFSLNLAAVRVTATAAEHPSFHKICPLFGSIFQLDTVPLRQCLWLQHAACRCPAAA
jgi:hypothetical protein